MSEEKTEEKPESPADDLVTTQHSITVKGRELNYTATTGRVVLKEEVVKDGVFEGHKPKAEVFLTAGSPRLEASLEQEGRPVQVIRRERP